MSVILLLLFGTLLGHCKGNVRGNNKILDHCSYNKSERVPWWYIYKPPADVVEPTGANFTYLTPDTGGLWFQSPERITHSSNMLELTMMSIHKKRINSLKNVRRAVITFEPRRGSTRTSARGILMATVDGGFLLMHTVPGLTDNMDKPVPFFPVKEMKNGHLLSCVSLNIDGLNKVAKALKEIEAKITFKYVPDVLRKSLKEWNFQSAPVKARQTSMYYLIRGNQTGVIGSPEGVAAALVARPPGERNCIYASFAARQLVMLNVYGQSRSKYLTTVCGEGFGVRNLESLCMKIKGPEGASVHYVTNHTDHSWFAVSTAAHWQQMGSSSPQFWVCTSLVDKEDLEAGGLLLCLQNYHLWLAFDNLKVAEPSCD